MPSVALSQYSRLYVAEPVLRTEIHHKIDSISETDWQRLFPELPDSLDLFRFIQNVGMDGYSFHSIVVSSADLPILYLPIFEFRQPIHAMVDGSLKFAIKALTPLFRRALSPHILGIGFVEGEWGAVGVDGSFPTNVLDSAWALALDAFEVLFQYLGCDLQLFLNFIDDSHMPKLPARAVRGFSEMQSYPSAVLPLPFESAEGYLASLSKGTRKNLKRKMNNAREVEVIWTRDPRPWLDTIFRLYTEYLNRHDFKFGAEGLAYFENICDAVLGAQYVLYLHKGRLLAFNLLVINNGVMVDKHYAMEPEGREFDLYFNSWMENVRYCIEKKIPTYLSGPAAEGTKARLGGKFLPSVTLFKHRRRLTHSVLGRFSRLIAYRPDIEVKDAPIGASELQSKK